MIIIILLITLTLSVMAFMRQPKFGKIAVGDRFERIKKSPNYRDGKFQNISHTPDLAEGVSLFTVLYEFLFTKHKRVAPSTLLPSVKTNLLNLNPNENCLVWFGHSSYFMQIDGMKFLVDPVFSGAASPLPNSVKSFKGSDVYTAADIPEIDYLFISHDHWDHLDYKTIIKLKPKIKKIITGLGTAEHLLYWGFDANKIYEKDWNEEINLSDGFVVNTLPARHFSGRGFKRQQSLWMSFALKTPSMKIFIGGDSGYDSHFKKIGEQFGPFDLAILECGQYNKNWKYIHSMPEELIAEVKELKAKKLLMVHWSKFVLAQHEWDEPIKMVSKDFIENNIPMITPMIGEKVNLSDHHQVFNKWWENVS